MHQRFHTHELLADAPAGMQIREVLFLESLAPGEGQGQRVAERKHAAVVLAVGARFIGQASSATWQTSVTSAVCPRLERGCPVIAISLAPVRRMASTRRTISSVSPL